jgi:demethylmenaquinone methyltransferase/2-methoxy-6-polyprenyl-1,4-benzoquinol methylase
MVLDLSHGRRVYDWLGVHKRVYRGIRWSVCFGRERYLQERAVAGLALKQGDSVLDLACGAGVNLPYLFDQVGPSGRIVAVDYSAGMLATARAAANAKGWSNVEFRQEDAAHLDLPPASFDGALCTFGLSAMPGEVAALAHAAVALKPSARFVVLDAKLFTGLARVFNPIAGPIFKYTTNWDYKKDVLRSFREALGEVTLDEYNSGSNFIAIGTKRSRDSHCHPESHSHCGNQ